MKKTSICKLLPGLLVITPVLLASCSDLDGGSTQEAKIGVTVINHLTPLDSSKEIIMTKGEYTVNLNATSREASITTTSLKFDNSDHAFATKGMRMTANGYTVEGLGYGEVYSFSGSEGNLSIGGSAEISNMSGRLNPFGYFSKTYVPGYLQYNSYPFRLVMSYQYGTEYTVKTLSGDSFYAGKTITTYPGQGGAPSNYENDGAMYRVIIDPAKMVADVIIYDAQFAEPMPKMTAMIVKGLKVTATRDGFTAKGEGIVPSAVEGGMETPYETFPFTSIEVRTTGGDLTQVAIDYVVAGRFTGKFTGSSLRVLQ